jgi:hemerythrin
METFVWNEHFITGEAQVDAEHQELVRIINWIIGHQKSAAEKWNWARFSTTWSNTPPHTSRTKRN